MFLVVGWQFVTSVGLRSVTPNFAFLFSWRSPDACFCPQSPFFYKDISHVGLVPINDLILTNGIYDDLMSK